jgi:3-hydroxyisobutyrate dehydrogenase-like beta-hydroxyacid dehydrogenase
MAHEVGFIGLGMMGEPMARRLLAQDYKLTIHDVRKEIVTELSDLGAVTAGSPAEVASKVETVMVSLPTPDVVKEVALGANGVASGNAVKTFVDLSTTGPVKAKEIAAGLKAKGITAIDAPVSGGVAGAKAGSLAVMMSGPKDLCDRLAPTLQIIGKNVFYIGPQPGQGQMMKLLNNLLSATALAASSEAVVLGAKFGLDPKTMIDVINVSSGRNSATLEKFPRSILPRKFDVGFRTELLHKDVRLCMEQADQLGVPMFIGHMVRQMWAMAQSQLGGQEDIGGIIKLLEKWAGVTVGKEG